MRLAGWRVAVRSSAASTPSLPWLSAACCFCARAHHAHTSEAYRHIKPATRRERPQEYPCMHKYFYIHMYTRYRPPSFLDPLSHRACRVDIQTTCIHAWEVYTLACDQNRRENTDHRVPAPLKSRHRCLLRSPGPLVPVPHRGPYRTGTVRRRGVPPLSARGMCRQTTGTLAVRKGNNNNKGARENDRREVLSV